MIRNIQNRLKALMSACVLSTIMTAGWSQSLIWLGTGDGSASYAYAVSADGSIAVGRIYAYGYSWGMRDYSYRWSAYGWGGHRLIPNDLESVALGVSADGKTVVGWARNSAHRPRAYRWTEHGGLEDLGTLGGSESRALAVSADGRVVVGWSLNTQFQARAFRWENGVMQDLGALDGFYTEALAVSADGRVVVGRAGNVYGTRAFRWENGVMQDLNLPSNRSEALGVSADGSVVVGVYTDTRGMHRAFRWTAAEGMQDLGSLRSSGDYVDSAAYGVSAYGHVVVGTSLGYAVRWTAAGIENLNTSYAHLLYEARLEAAYAVSPDGRYIVGYGARGPLWNRQAYLLDTGCVVHNGDVDMNRCVDDADLLAVLFAVGSQGGRVDVNCDRFVDDADLLVVLLNFGSGCNTDR